MPRQGRIDVPGALHHVIVRGINRGRLFLSAADYEDFLSRFGRLLESTSTGCLAWALMPNHVHLLVQTGSLALGKVMQRLLTGYAVAFNWRHRRSGKLYQNRYTSILCEREAYLLELTRYIHLNPLRAGLVGDLKGLARYRWCGHGGVLGRGNQAWQDVAGVLGQFGRRQGRAREAYETFVAEGVKVGRRPELVGGGLLRSAGGHVEYLTRRRGGERMVGDERILGNSEFVERILRAAGAREEDRSRKRRKWTTKQVIAKAAKDSGVEVEAMLGNGKRPSQSQARALACFWLVEELGLQEVDVAHDLGITQPAVSKSVVRGRALVTREQLRLDGERRKL